MHRAVSLAGAIAPLAALLACGEAGDQTSVGGATAAARPTDVPPSVQLVDPSSTPGGGPAPGNSPAPGDAGASRPPEPSDAGNRAEPSDATTFALGFERDIHPFLQRLCSPCHATDRVAGHNVASPNVAVAYAYARELGFRLIERTRSGMPPRPFCLGGPGTPGCATLEELSRLEAWFEAGSAP